MTDELVTRWRREAPRLREARTRFLESLVAIRELADFASEHVVKLDQKSGPISINIKLGDLAPGKAGDPGPTLTGFVDHLSSTLTKSMAGAEDSDDGDDVGVDIVEVINDAIKEYRSSLPEETDTRALDYLVTIEKPRARVDVLLASLLIAAISDFEVLFTAIAGFFFRIHPEALRAQDAKISWSEVESYSSVEDLRSHFIDERVSQLMWGGFDDWMKWLSNQLKIKYEDASLDPAGTIEVFQRRHIIVHNGGLVSPQYLAKVAHVPTGLTVGTALRVDIEYLSAALSKIAVLGAALVFLVSCKLCPGESQREGIDNDILTVIFRLLQEKQWETVERISTIALPEMTRGFECNAVRVNRWIAQKRLKGTDSIAHEVKRWDISALQRTFELAQKALLDDPVAVEVALDLAKSGELPREAIDTWPLLDDLRDSITERIATSDEAIHETRNDEGPAEDPAEQVSTASDAGAD